MQQTWRQIFIVATQTDIPWFILPPTCLYFCMTTSGHAPNERTDGVLGYLLPDLDQDIAELLVFSLP